MAKKKVFIFAGIIIAIIIFSTGLLSGGYFWLQAKVGQKIIFTNNSDASIESVEIKFSNKELNLNDYRIKIIYLQKHNSQY